MWNLVYFGEFQLKTKYLRFWGVRGRKRAPEPIKTTGITVVFTRWRKGAFSRKFMEFL